MVDIQQGPLGALEHHAAAAPAQPMQGTGDIVNHRPDLFSLGKPLVEHLAVSEHQIFAMTDLEMRVYPRTPAATPPPA